MNFGNVLSKIKDNEAALKSYNKAMALNPNFVDIYYNRAVFFEDLKKLQSKFWEKTALGMAISSFIITYTRDSNPRLRKYKHLIHNLSLTYQQIFYFLHKYYFKKKKNIYISIIFFLLFLLCVHALYTLYIIVPIIFSLFIFSIKERKLRMFSEKFIILFITPTAVVYFLVIIITGFSNEFSGNLNINFLVANLAAVISKSFVPGIVSVFFDEHLQTTSFLTSISSRLISIKALLNLFYTQTIIFLILFFSFFLTVCNFLFKKSNIFDLIILVFFIFFIFLNKIPFDRVYISFIYFFMFYFSRFSL
jgi:hypothetical protein